MKKTIRSCLFSIAILMISGLTGYAAPLLKNGGFEESGSSGTVKSWKAADWSPKHNPVKLVVDGTDAPEGNNYVRILADTSGGNLVVMQDIRQPEAGHYCLTLKCRPEQGGETYASAVGIQSGKNVVYENTARVSDSTQWTDQKLEFDLPKNMEILRILLRTTGSASFDAVNVARQDSVRP